jgi:hypothetical protein
MRRRSSYWIVGAALAALAWQSTAQTPPPAAAPAGPTPAERAI